MSAEQVTFTFFISFTLLFILLLYKNIFCGTKNEVLLSVFLEMMKIMIPTCMQYYCNK